VPPEHARCTDAGGDDPASARIWVGDDDRHAVDAQRVAQVDREEPEEPVAGKRLEVGERAAQLAPGDGARVGLDVAAGQQVRVPRRIAGPYLCAPAL
jgi:hypothetical protein